MVPSMATVLGRYLTAQLAGEVKDALAVVDEALARGCSVRALQRDVVAAAQREIGRRWESNELSVAHEHAATAIAQRVLVHLFERAPQPPARAATVVVACVEGELHDLPARLVADYLELAGFTVRYLGASVPTAELPAILADFPPAALALSTTMTLHAPSLRAAVATIRASHPALPLLAGGQILRWIPDIGDQLGVTVAGDDPDEMLAVVERAVGGGA